MTNNKLHSFVIPSNQFNKIFGGQDKVQTTYGQSETTYDKTVTTDGFNDDNNDGQQDECETVYVRSTTTLK
jgi:hypothetical protein